jgi:hypothetical protein
MDIELGEVLGPLEFIDEFGDEGRKYFFFTVIVFNAW